MTKVSSVISVLWALGLASLLGLSGCEASNGTSSGDLSSSVEESSDTSEVSSSSEESSSENESSSNKNTESSGTPDVSSSESSIESSSEAATTSVSSDDNQPSSSSQFSSSSEVLEEVISGVDESYAKEFADTPKKELTEYIFDDAEVRTYEVIMPKQNLEFIDNAPMDEIYKEGALIVDGDTISPVGIRYKGNEGAWYDCVSGGPFSNGGTGKKICPLNMKIKINWDGRDTTFFGLKKFQLHAMNTYDSELRERIGYWFFRQMGVPSPRVVHIKLKINGEYEGVFTHVETIDGRFTRYNFDDGSGNLYKKVWPIQYDGSANVTKNFLSHLKTNEDENPSFDMIQSFGDALEEAEGETEVQAVIEEWMDVDATLNIPAVAYTLDDDDGLFHWYADDETSKNKARPHNYFFYEEPVLKKIYLIPWDNDHMLDKVAIKDTMNAVEIWDYFGETSHECLNFGYGWRQRSASCDKLIAGLASFTDKYQETLQRLYDGPFNEYEAVLNTWIEQIRPAMIEMNTLGKKRGSVTSWEAGVAKLQRELIDAKEGLEIRLNTNSIEN